MLLTLTININVRRKSYGERQAFEADIFSRTNQYFRVLIKKLYYQLLRVLVLELRDY